jgi:hypothetical protein
MVRRIFFLLICGVGWIAGAWMCASGIRCVLRALESATWPAVPGRIVASHVVRHVSHGRHGSSTSYTPSIQYSYRVAGRDYTCSEIMPGRNWGSKSAYREVDAHPVGSTSAIHYLTADPNIAVLEAGWHAENLGQALMGMIFLAFSSIFAWVAFNTTDGATGSKQVTWRPGSSWVLIPLIAWLVLTGAGLIWLS